MRAILPIVVALTTLALAGCAGDGEPPSSGATTTAPAAVTPEFAANVTASSVLPSTATPPAGFPPLTPRQPTPIFNPVTGVTRIPIQLEPAADAGSDDCPETWIVFENDTYSVCFPPNFYAHSWFTDASTIHFSLRLIAGEPLAYSPWTLTLSTVPTYSPPQEFVYQAEQIVTDADTALPD